MNLILLLVLAGLASAEVDVMDLLGEETISQLKGDFKSVDKD